jgi:hypothetical protein
MNSKKISQLPYVGNKGFTPEDLLVVVNYSNPSGVTKKTKIAEYANYVKKQINFTTDNITYSGSDIDCLKIKSGMSLTDVITVIGNLLCPTPQPNIRCNDLDLPLPLRGECQNPLQYVFNETITSWCELHPPQLPCTSNVNSMEYLFDQVIQSWINIHPPSKPCTTNVNAMDYLFDQVIESWEDFHPPARPCTSNINAMGYLFNNVINSWRNQ